MYTATDTRIELRNYQKDVIKRADKILAKYRIVYLSMQVRTGKTLTSLFLADQMHVGKVLFVTKKKALKSIQDDYSKCRYQVRFTLDTINYASLHKVEEEYDVIIIDEAHSFGAYPKPSQRTKRLRAICQSARFIIYLSGTPTPESYSQLYHQMWLSGDRSPWVWYSTFYKWAKSYVNITEKRIGARTIRDYSDANKDRIMEDISLFMVTMTQKKAGFESAVEEHVLEVDMKPVTRDAFASIRKHRLWVKGDKNIDTFNEGDESDICTTESAADRMNKLHQISGGSVIMDNGEVHILDTSKAVFIKNHFRGEKLAIIYKYRGEREILKEVFGELVTEDIGEFEDREESVFIGQVVSVREGTSLKAATALVMYSIDFSATSYWQVRARTQFKDRASTNLYWVFAGGLIEQHILQRVREKKNFTSSYFNTIQ